MEKISQAQIEEITDEIELTEAWVKQYRPRGLARQLIEAVLSDLKMEVASGEVPDIFGM